MSVVNSFSVVYMDEKRPASLLIEGLTDLSGMIFLPIVLLSAIAMGYIFTQPRKSKSNLEVEEAGGDEFVWDDDIVADGQNNLMTTMYGKMSAKALTLCALYTAQGIPSRTSPISSIPAFWACTSSPKPGTSTTTVVSVRKLITNTV